MSEVSIFSLHIKLNLQKTLFENNLNPFLYSQGPYSLKTIVISNTQGYCFINVVCVQSNGVCGKHVNV